MAPTLEIKRLKERNAELLEVLIALRNAVGLTGGEVWDEPDETPVYDDNPDLTIGLAKRIERLIQGK